MKNPNKRDLKKDGKPFNINISFNINSKNVTNNQLVPHLRSAEQKQRDRLVGLLSRTPKNVQQPKQSRDSTQINRQHPRLQKSKRNSMDLTALTCHDFHKKKTQPKSDKPSFKKKNSKNNDLKLTISKPNNIVRKKTNQSKISPVALEVIFRDYQKGNITLDQMKEVITELFNSQGSRSRRQSFELNFTNAKTLKQNSSNIGSLDPKKLEKMRKRNCKSERGDISTKKNISHNQSFLSSARQSAVIRNIVNLKGINSSLMISSGDEDTSPPSPRLEDSRTHYQVKTTNSVVDMKQKIKKQRNLYESEQIKLLKFSFENRMAIKIQRVWRQFQTKKLIYHLMEEMNRNQEGFMLDTDPTSSVKNEKLVIFNRQNKNQSEFINLAEQGQLQFNVRNFQFERESQNHEQPMNKDNFAEYLSSCMDNQDHPQKESKNLSNQELVEQQFLQEMVINYRSQGSNQVNLSDVIRILRVDLQNKQLSKEQCLQNMLEMISNYQQVQQQQQPEEQEQQFEVQEEIRSPFKQEDTEFNEIGSFTNKFQSKQMPPNPIQYEMNTSGSQMELDISDYDLKGMNVDSIEQALRHRETILLKKREKQLNLLTFKNQSGRVCEEVYQQEKSKVQKWYKSELNDLKQAKRSLLKGYKDAKNIIDKLSGTLDDFDNLDKSRGVVKCLSDNYLLKTALNYKQYIQRKNENDDSSTKKQTRLKRQKQHREVQPEQQDYTTLQYEEISKEFDQVSEHQRETLGYVEQPAITEAKQISLFDSDADESNRKLKYLCSEDKDDIFEFIFLDLCLQLYLESPKTGKIVKSLEKTIQNSKRVSKIPKGIKTSLTHVKDYLQKLGNYILEFHKQSLNKVEFPMGPTAAEMLRYMHQIAQDDKEISSVNNDETAPLVLAGTIFQTYQKLPENNLKLEKYYEDPEKEHNRTLLLNSVMHIHNKALYDCVNENLDQERPYGLWGKPFPWKKSVKSRMQFNESQKEKKLKRSLQKTIQTCSYLCGILVDKEQSLFANVNVSNQYVNHIKEDRLSKMLANDLIENEERWMFYDDEETEVLIELSNFAAKQLIYEVVDDLISLIKSKKEGFSKRGEI